MGKKRNREKGWYVVHEGSTGRRTCVRGPYRYEETAVAVRTEMERGDDLDDDDRGFVEEQCRNYLIVDAASLDDMEAAP